MNAGKYRVERSLGHGPVVCLAVLLVVLAAGGLTVVGSAAAQDVVEMDSSSGATVDAPGLTPNNTTSTSSFMEVVDQSENRTEFVVSEGAEFVPADNTSANVTVDRSGNQTTVVVENRSDDDVSTNEIELAGISYPAEINYQDDLQVEYVLSNGDFFPGLVALVSLDVEGTGDDADTNVPVPQLGTASGTLTVTNIEQNFQPGDVATFEVSATNAGSITSQVSITGDLEIPELEGVVTDEFDRPISRATVEVLKNGTREGLLFTNRNGTWSQELDPGVYEVNVSANGVSTSKLVEHTAPNTTTSHLLELCQGQDIRVRTASPSIAAPVGFQACVDATEYEWDFDDGTTGQGPAVSNQYETAGTYEVALTADGETYTRNVTVNDTEIVIQEYRNAFAGLVLEGVTKESLYRIDAEAVGDVGSVTVAVDGQTYEATEIDSKKGVWEATISTSERNDDAVVQITAVDNDGNKAVEETYLDLIELPSGVDFLLDIGSVADPPSIADRIPYFGEEDSLIPTVNYQIADITLIDDARAVDAPAPKPWTTDLGFNVTARFGIGTQIPGGTFSTDGLITGSFTKAGFSIEGGGGADLRFSPDNGLESGSKIFLTIGVSRTLGWSPPKLDSGVEVTGGVSLSPAITYNGNNWEPTIVTSFTGQAKAKQEIPPNTGVGVSATVGGNVDISADLRIPGGLNFLFEDGTISPRLFVEGDLDAIVYSKSIKIVLPDWTISISDILNSPDRRYLVDEGEWTVQDRRGPNPIPSVPSVDEPGTADAGNALGATGGTSITRLTNRSFEDTKPAFATAGDREVVVWSSQNEEKSVLEGQDIRARTNEGFGWDGSTLTQITDDSRHDDTPAVAGNASGDDLLAAWTRTDVNLSAANITAPEAAYPYQEIAVSLFDGDTGEWGNITLLTNTSARAHGPAVASNGDQWLVAWEENPAANRSVFENRTVEYALLDGTSVVTRGSIDNATGPAVGTDDGAFTLGYYRPELNGTEQGTVAVGTVGTGGNFTGVTAFNVTQYVAHDVDDGRLAWADDIENETVLSYYNGTTATDPPLDGNISNVQETSLDVEGENVLLAYRGRPGTAEAQDLVYRVADESGSVNVAVDPGANTAATIDAPQAGWLPTETSVTTGTPALAVGPVETSVADDDPTNGTVTVTLANRGEITAEKVPTRLEYGNETFNLSFAAVPANGTATANLSVNTTAVDPTVPGEVVIDPEGELAEDAVRNRTLKTKLFTADVTIDNAPAYIESNGTINAVIEVANRGVLPANATVSVVANGNTTTTEYGNTTVALNETVPGESVFEVVSIPLDGAEDGDPIQVAIESPAVDADRTTAGFDDTVGPVVPQRGPVSVTLVDPLGDPVPNATVFVGPDGDRSNENGTTTVFAEVGLRNLTIEHPGYRTVTDQVNVTPEGLSTTVSLLPDVELVSVDVPDTAVVSETVVANATIENVGDAPVTERLNLSVGNDTVDSVPVELDPGSQVEVPVTWNTTDALPGVYTLTVTTSTQNETASLDLLEATTEFLVNVTGTDSSVVEGETLLVEATVENAGTVNGTGEITLDIDGQRDAVNATLATGESTTVELGWDTSVGDARTYTATVASESDADSTGATVLAQPFFEVSVLGANEPAAGEDVVVEFAVENTGDVADTQTVTLTTAPATGGNATGTTVTLGGNESTVQTLSVGTEPGDVGTYTATVASADDTANANVTVLAQAAFTVEIVDTTQPVEGADLVVDVAVENVGDLNGTQTVTLDAGALGTDNTTLALAGGESATETLTVATDDGDAGGYTLTVTTEDDADSANVTVLAPAQFGVGIVGTSDPVEGEEFVVTATVENLGDVEGTQTVTLDVAGLGADNATLTLAAGESVEQPLSVATGAGDAGEYAATVASADDTANTTVVVDTPATAALSGLDIAGSGANATLTEGDNLTVSVTVKNTGDRAGSFNVTLAAGTAVSRTDTTGELAAGTNETLSFTNVTGSLTDGTYVVTASTADDAVSGEVTVEAPVGLRFPDQNASEQSEATVTNVSSDGEALLLVTSEQDGTDTVAGVANGTFEDVSVTVALEAYIGFPDNYTAHLVPAADASGSYTPGDALSANTTDAVLLSETARVTTVTGAPDVEIIDGSPAMDTTGDGLLNDLRGDESFDIFDVQTLFSAYSEGSPELQNNSEQFNFQGSNPDQVTIFDVQALFSQLTG